MANTISIPASYQTLYLIFHNTDWPVPQTHIFPIQILILRSPRPSSPLMKPMKALLTLHFVPILLITPHPQKIKVESRPSTALGLEMLRLQVVGVEVG